MKENIDIEILKTSKLFEGLKDDNVKSIINCMDCRHYKYRKDEVIINEGSIVDDIGIIISGNAHSIKQEISGKKLIITNLKPGSVVGVLLAGSKKRKSPVTVQAISDMSVLFFPISKLIFRCRRNCHLHDILLENYIDCIAEKALVLHDRNDCIMRSTVRDKILTYLMQISDSEASCTFTIPVDREGMAEYLNVDRSALSRELSRMKKEGLIDYYKNSFKILRK